MPKKAKIGNRLNEVKFEETGTNAERIQKKIEKTTAKTKEIWLNSGRIYDILKDEDVEADDVLRNLKETSRNCISPCTWYSKKDIVFMLSKICGMEAKSEEK
jgi:hypothetical protein